MSIQSCNSLWPSVTSIAFRIPILFDRERGNLEKPEDRGIGSCWNAPKGGKEWWKMEERMASELTKGRSDTERKTRTADFQQTANSSSKANEQWKGNRERTKTASIISSPPMSKVYTDTQELLTCATTNKLTSVVQSQWRHSMAMLTIAWRGPLPWKTLINRWEGRWSRASRVIYTSF